MNYSEALAYLDSFINLERSAQTAAARAVITLDSVREFAGRLGNPERKFPALHVAGTKGKGSTCAFAASILSAAGLRVGLYTSPHLQDIRERISIGGTLIGEAEFARILTDAYPVLDELRNRPAGERRPTYFEILTHLAFTHFAEKNVDCAVVEVGLGGRLDATNIVQPAACAITSISFDHMAILGNTLAEIAGEKAGILKPGVTAVVAPQCDEAMSAIRAKASAVGAPLECVGAELVVTELEPSDKDSAWPLPRARVALPDGRSFTATLGLHGPFQIENWATAVRLADVMFTKLRGGMLPTEAVEAGSRNVVWPGRLEEVQASPRIILDGAHNDYSIKLVCKELLSRAHPVSRPLVVLFACAKDKDHHAMLRALSDAAPDAMVFTHSGNVRGREPEDLAHVWNSLSKVPVHTSTDAASGLFKARALAGADGLILVTGSLYLVGAIKDALEGKIFSS